MGLTISPTWFVDCGSFALLVFMTPDFGVWIKCGDPDLLFFAVGL